jgi:hypothetical protein
MRQEDRHGSPVPQDFTKCEVGGLGLTWVQAIPSSSSQLTLK